MKNVFRSIFVLSALSVPALQAQSVQDVQNLATLVASPFTVLQTITGSDGTVCTLAKVPGATILAYFQCALAGQALKPVEFSSTSTKSGYILLAQGQVMCMIALNPTASAVSWGSIGIAPAVGVAWSCANGPGGTVVSGTTNWP